MEIAAGGRVHQTDSIAVLEEADVILIYRWIFPSWCDNPVVIAVFVMVTCHLLLLRANRVRLDVRMQESSSIAHVLEGEF